MMKKYIIFFILTLSLSSHDIRFIRNSDGTVNDYKTKLQWQDNYDNKKIKIANWINAISYCESLTLGGHNDWRLPNINELYSIVNRDKINPSFDKHFVFQKVTDNYVGEYWSSTSVIGKEDDAWLINFFDGSTEWMGKTNGAEVRCVRDLN